MFLVFYAVSRSGIIYKVIDWGNDKTFAWARRSGTGSNVMRQGHETLLETNDNNKKYLKKLFNVLEYGEWVSSMNGVVLFTTLPNVKMTTWATRINDRVFMFTSHRIRIWLCVKYKVYQKMWILKKAWQLSCTIITSNFWFKVNGHL